MALKIKDRGLLNRLPEDFPLTKEELSEGVGDFSFLAPQSFFAKINRADPSCPIRLQIIPRKEEREIQDYEEQDPLHEKDFEKTKGLVQRYENRCILKVTDQCAVHCRFCFRRRILSLQGSISDQELLKAGEYLASHLELKELLITGGDPLMLPGARLKEIIRVIRLYRPDLRLRLGSRIPVVWPELVEPGLLELFKESQPFRLSLHVNHPQELTGLSRVLVQAIHKEGIEILSQTVLLKGINDDLETLKSLFLEFRGLGIKPYYLFALDPAPGTSHFRVAITKGLRLMARLKSILPEGSLPVFALDLPGGGGKLPVAELKLGKYFGNYLEVEDPLGRRYLWPEKE